MSSTSSTLNNTSGLNSVPMHDGSNQTVWAAGMKAYLWFAKLWPYVDWTKTEPEAPDNESDDPNYQTKFDAWNEADEQAIGAILMKIPYQYHHLATKANGEDRNSKELWEAIKAQFGKTGIAGVYSEFLSAIHFHVREGENPVPALGNLTSIIQRLTESNIKLDGNLQVLLYLAALPSSWEGFKTSVLTSCTGNNWNVSNILTLIKNEWNRRSTRQQTSLQSRISGVKRHRFNPNWKKQKKQRGEGQQQQDQQSGSSSQPNNGKKRGSRGGKKYKGKKKAFESVEVAQASVTPNDFEMAADSASLMQKIMISVVGHFAKDPDNF